MPIRTAFKIRTEKYSPSLTDSRMRHLYIFQNRLYRTCSSRAFQRVVMSLGFYDSLLLLSFVRNNWVYGNLEFYCNHRVFKCLRLEIWPEYCLLLSVTTEYMGTRWVPTHSHDGITEIKEKIVRHSRTHYNRVGTWFEARNCISEPGPQEPYRDIFYKHHVERHMKMSRQYGNISQNTSEGGILEKKILLNSSFDYICTKHIILVD
jgi:hypothetical protein